LRSKDSKDRPNIHAERLCSVFSATSAGANYLDDVLATRPVQVNSERLDLVSALRSWRIASFLNNQDRVVLACGETVVVEGDADDRGGT
jgi:hypothetical protein